MLHIVLVFAPALGALIAGFFGRALGDRGAQIVTCALMGLSALCAWGGLFLYIGEPVFKVPVLSWINVGGLEVDWVLRVDSLSTVMMLVPW